MLTTQQHRILWKTLFFALFILAPPLDLFRFDLSQNHFILLGHDWTLGIQEYRSGQIGTGEMILNMFLRFFLPLGLVVGGGLYVSWKWGRLYCGWLCPHFSVVELINACMRRASGKLSIWDRKPLPEMQSDGTRIKPRRGWWLLTWLAIVGFAFLWAVVLLTYLLPPKQVYTDLLHLSLPRGPFLFITVGTLLLVIEFAFARHLFCRFGCAIGLFQSLIWMGNRKAMVVAFDRRRARDCVSCDASCEHACPMRLKPRSSKRHMFTCTQCLQCVEACEKVQLLQMADNPPLLKALEGPCALDASARDFGNKPTVPPSCFQWENKNKRCCTE